MFECLKHSFEFKHEEYCCPVCELVDEMPSQKDFDELQEKVDDLEDDIGRLCQERDSLELAVDRKDNEIERLQGIINEKSNKL